MNNPYSDYPRKYYWHTWFAWRPVRYTHNKRWVWMRTIYRRAKFKTYVTYDSWQSHEYADVFGMLVLPEKPEHQRY